MSTQKNDFACDIHFAVYKAGGQVKLAKLLGVAQPNISSWLYGKSLIPLHHAEKLEQLYGPEITVVSLRPDIAKYLKYFGVCLDNIHNTV